MELTTLSALSPLDGRYARKLAPLRRHFSEFGLIRNRVRVEVAWLCALSTETRLAEIPAFSPRTLNELALVVDVFGEPDAAAVKAIESRTNHDVKAIEYWLKERLSTNAEVGTVAEFIHFACTSEDINNVAHALMLAESRRDVLLPAMDAVIARLTDMAHSLADVPMMSRTHGQAATPTTLGKEMANIVARLRRNRQRAADVAMQAKMNGAVGNYNAHLSAYPDFDWEGFSRRVVEALGLEFNPYTIQIEPHDAMAEYFDAVARFNTVLLDAARDFWTYISLGFFRQRLKEGEVGSSTMPHKVNPIDFENAEGNLGIANALLRHLSDKLPVSRMQRDLTDSTVLRNMGVGLGHSLLAWDSFLRGLEKLEAAPERMREDLDQNWEVLAEPIQTVMRRYGVAEPYEKLKALTRGQRVTRETLQAFVAQLEIPADARERLLAMAPWDYLGKASDLARRI